MHSDLHYEYTIPVFLQWTQIIYVQKYTQFLALFHRETDVKAVAKHGDSDCETRSKSYACWW